MYNFLWDVSTDCLECLHGLLSPRNWLRALRRLVLGGGLTSKRRSRPPVVNYRPGVERLEDRTVPTSTTITLGLSVTTSVYGQNFVATAQVYPDTGSPIPTGNVDFYNGATLLAAEAVNGSALASYTVTDLPVGADTITGHYVGDSNFTGSISSGQTETVSKASTSVSLTSSANPSVLFQSVTFTATVSATSPGGGTPGGTVSFYNGATLMGTGSLSSGVATYSTSSLVLGSGNSITASYGGNPDYNSSTSSTLTQTVDQDATTTTTLTSGTNPSIHDNDVSYATSVTVSGAGA